jgi:hypothetical protein
VRRELLVELDIGGTWRDATAADDVYTRDPVTIARGRADEAGQASPSSCHLTLDNRDGRYSPRNPLGPYFGQFGRNTPVRVGITTDVTYDAYSSQQGTGDLSFTHTPTGKPTGVMVFVWQYNTNTGQINSVTYGGVPMERKTFGLFLLGATNAVGYLYWLNRDIPTGPQTVTVDTSAATLRVASCLTVTGGSHAELEASPFGYSNAAPSANPAISVGSFTRPVALFGSLLSELDDPASISAGFGHTQIAEHDLGTETVAVERATLGTLEPGPAYISGWVAPSAHWGIMAAAVRAVHYRFWGEVSSLPPKWDLSGNDAYVPIEAAGSLRRLGQGKDPAQTGLRAFLESQTNLARYWPLSGAKGTTYSLDVAPMWGVSTTGLKFFSEAGPGNYVYGEEAGSEFLGTGMALFNSDAGPQRADIAAAGSDVALDFVYRTDEMGSFTAVIADYAGTQWSLAFDPTGMVQASFDDGENGPIGFSPAGPVPELLDTTAHHCRFQLLQNGANTDFAVYIDGALIDSGTMPDFVLVDVATLRLYLSRTGTQQYIVLSHLAVWAFDPATWPSAADVTEAARGYAGEPAGERVARVLGLAGVDLTLVGDPADSQLMGPQYAESMLAQVRDAEVTDNGIFAEPRDAAGVLYRTGRSLYNQPATVTLDYAGGHVADPFEPVDDDQATRNDVTMSRRDGGSYRVQQTTGRMSTQAPPDGVGRYPDDASVNCVDDTAIPPYAQWALHMGTLDAARFPSITVNLAAPDLDDATEAALLAVDLGDRLEVQNAEAANIYDPLSLLVQGYTETIGPVEHVWSANCSPGELWEVVTLNDPSSRIGAGPCELTAAVDADDVTLSVLASDGVTLWTTDPAQFPLDVMVGGERMTVTAITGTTPGTAQAFTVTRAVNGVAKGHSAGDLLTLARRAVWAL